MEEEVVYFKCKGQGTVTVAVATVYFGEFSGSRRKPYEATPQEWDLYLRPTEQFIQVEKPSEENTEKPSEENAEKKETQEDKAEKKQTRSKKHAQAADTAKEE